MTEIEAVRKIRGFSISEGVREAAETAVELLSVFDLQPEEVLPGGTTPFQRSRIRDLYPSYLRGILRMSLRCNQARCLEVTKADLGFYPDGEVLLTLRSANIVSMNNVENVEETPVRKLASRLKGWLHGQEVP